MKNKPLIITLICLLVITSIGLIIFMISVMNKKINFRGFSYNYKVSNKLVMDKNYNNKYESIEINSSDADIYIKDTDADNIRVIIYGDKERLNVKDDSSLKIEFDATKCIGFCFNKKINKIEVYLPSNYNKDLIINNNYGDIKIGNTSANIIVNEDCGDVEVSSAKKINVKNKYGDINIGKATNINIKADCGDVDIGEANYLNVSNKYGDVTIDKVNNYVNIIDNCGDIEIDNLNITKNSKIEDNYGDIEIGNTNEIYIDAKTSLGDVDINKNYRKSDVVLDIKNDCGDIEVDN